MDQLMSMAVPYAIIIGIFYFLIFRPQQQKQKEHKNMLANLQKNDQVVTNSGIHGVVAAVKDDTISLRVDDGTRIEFDKDVIAVVKKRTADNEKG